jgi:protein-tyrosine phosphatase
MFNLIQQPAGRNDAHIFDYSKITESIFIGSDFCKGGVCLLHEEEFKQLGISVEINLSFENNELPPKNIEVYLWLPVVDGYAPSEMQLLIGSTAINDSLRKGKKVYVHCRNGHGRSPALVAAYLMRYKGMSIEEAAKTIKLKRPESHLEKVQVEALTSFANSQLR